MWTRSELKQNAKEALKRNYWKAVLVSFIMILLGGGLSPAASASWKTDGSRYDEKVGEYIMENDALPDSAIASAVDELEKADVGVVTAVAVAMIVVCIIVIVIIAAVMAFEVFVANPLIIGSQRFMIKSLEGSGNISELGYTFDHSYLNGVKTMFFRELHIFLWALLFIIPGIYKKYQYYMVEYILTERPDMPYKEVLNLSKEMMEGQKWNAFVLDLSFILWHMLGTITCGLAEVLYVRPYINLTRASLYCTLSKGHGYTDGL